MKLKKPGTGNSQKGKTVDLEAAVDFISEAEARGGTQKQIAFPWEEVDAKQTKAFNLRLPLDLYEKLRFVADNTPRVSMNTICVDNLEPVIEELLQNILKKEG